MYGTYFELVIGSENGPGYCSWFTDLLWTGWSGVQSLVGEGIFSFPKPTQTSLGVHQASSIRYQACYWGVMQPGHVVDHAPLSGAKVRAKLSDTFTLHLCL